MKIFGKSKINTRDGVSYSKILQFRSWARNIRRFVSDVISNHYCAVLTANIKFHYLLANELRYSGAVVKWLSPLHNFLRQSLDSDSAQVQTLLAVCRRFAMVRISDNGPS